MILILSFCVAGIATGCQNKVDIEDRNYVMSLGVQGMEGQTEYEVTYEMADLTKTTEEGGGRQQGKVETWEGDSLEAVEEEQQKTDDKRMDYGHLKAILLKNDLWNTESVDNMMEELETKGDVAGTTLIFFVEESPEKYMEIANQSGASLGEYLERMMANHKEDGAEEYNLSDLLREWREGTLWEQKDETEKTNQKSIPYLRIVQEKIYLTEWDRKGKREEKESLKEVSQEVLRFHIRANSDREEDQEIKLRMKDRILPYLQQLFSSCTSKEACMRQAEENMEEIQTVVKEACQEEQENLEAKVYLCRESFPMKEYGDILLPSGTYDALRIDLGEGQGKNWWCMMYPSLCMVDGVVEERQETVEEETENEITFHIKWKVGEIFKKLFATD